MSVAVVIPTFNRAHLLSRALESVLTQSQPADEIVVIDDGSTDNTSRLIKANFPQVLLIHTDNLGVSHARNCGILAANSDWIAFLDSDDEWKHHKLATQLETLKLNPEYKICHSDEKWIRNDHHLNQKEKHKKHGGWIFEDCLPLCAISPSAAIIHRSVFDDVGLFDESLPACEDYDLWLRITAKYPVLFIAQPLIVKYGGHTDQLSQKHWGMDRFRIQALENIINTGELKLEYHLAALHMLVEKLSILIQGAEKKNNQDILYHYAIKMEYYQLQLNKQTQRLT
ncbi:MAG: glycosyltransferase [Gammaproteobacteria bacterium]|nr:glycosyltransferase [Gammaproteobacteria bacterium]